MLFLGSFFAIITYLSKLFKPLPSAHAVVDGSTTPPFHALGFIH